MDRNAPYSMLRAQINRRHFIRNSAFGCLAGLSGTSIMANSDGPSPPYRIQLEVCTRLFDGTQCYTHPRAGIVPGAGENGLPRVVMTMNTLDLNGDDVFRGLYGLYTDNLGRSWIEPARISNLDPRPVTLQGKSCPMGVSDFWPKYHSASKKLLGTGHYVVYTPDWKVIEKRPRHTTYSVYDPETNEWSLWQTLEMPDKLHFVDAGAGSTQRLDLPDGTILLPIYFRPQHENSLVTVVRCAFDGKKLTYLEHGDELSIVDDTRGLHEPSLARFQGQFFLTIRNDLRGYVTRSTDGLQFEPIREWKFDDGSPLGNYNTQQHWVTHSDALYLVYTRRGADNDHVFRNRAPLFMAQVNPNRLVVIRETEQVLVPERGARLGNFGVTDINPKETWVTVSEWMQPKGVEKYGSDGSVYTARILWE